MDLLLQSVVILSPQSGFHQQTVDVLIRNGIIESIAAGITADDVKTVNAKGQYLSPGFFDLNCSIGELGLETKEDLITGSRAAAAGGYTGLAVLPDMQPPVHSKAEVAYLVNKSAGGLVDIFPLGAVSYERKGLDMAELYDMYLSGARAFTDGNHPIQNAGLMERALLYVQAFDALIISNPEDAAIAGQSKMHEGEISTLLGMKGIPALAEELMIARDLYLAEYTHAPVHFTTLSSAGSIELIRQAKKKGMRVTCDVAAHHLMLTDEYLMGFDSLYKVKPPLRTHTDKNALIAGLQDGTIDAIVSQHTPHEVEYKAVEFEIAAYGITGLQTAFSLAVMCGLQPDLLVQKMCVAPRQILKLDVPLIEVGQAANLTLFDPQAKWQYTLQNNQSKSANSPFIGQTLTGRITLTCNHNQVYFN